MSSHRRCWQLKKKMLSLQHPSAHLWPYYISGLFRIPSLLLLFQTKPLSRWTDKWARPMPTSATEGPAGAGSTVALPREVMCWQGPLQSPPVAFWRAPAGTEAQCPSWASSKSNPVVAPKMGSLWSATSHGNERHFGTDLPVTAWGHQHQKACGPSPARSAWSPFCLWAVTRTDARHPKTFTPAFRIVHNCLRLPSVLETQCWTPLKVPQASQVTGAHPERYFWEPWHGSFAYVKTCGTMGYVTSTNFPVLFFQ